MTAVHTENTILDHEIDDLLLRARGLALVRELLAARGASSSELDAHAKELERVRGELIRTIGGVSGSPRSGVPDTAFPQAVSGTAFGGA